MCMISKKKSPAHFCHGRPTERQAPAAALLGPDRNLDCGENIPVNEQIAVASLPADVALSPEGAPALHLRSVVGRRNGRRSRPTLNTHDMGTHDMSDDLKYQLRLTLNDGFAQTARG